MMGCHSVIALLVILAFNCVYVSCNYDSKTITKRPVQAVHMTLWGDNKVMFTWLNPVQYKPGDLVFDPKCQYGNSTLNLINTAQGMAYTYRAGMFNLTLNSAVMDVTGLKDDIFYRCGDSGYGWGQVNSFRVESPSVYQRQSGNIALIADMGVSNSSDTIEALSQFTQSGLVKLVVHDGDISYADNFSDKNNSYIWVDYMQQIEKFTANVPYMTAPGNHEAQFNFEAYRNWLPMPYEASGSKSPYWFYFDYMGIHFLSFSTEHNFNQTSEQFAFMKQDLIKANKNSAGVPWVVVFGNRPLYCSSLVAEHRCLYDAPLFRNYIEDLLYGQNVDVYLSGHDHSYERSYPVYKGKVVQTDYHNAKAPVYIVDGEAGSPEPNDPSFLPNVEWRAHFYPSWNNGFLIVQPTPSTLRFQYIRSKDRFPVDFFSITKY